MMKRWHVITPEYGEVIPITDDGQGPTEYGCDVIEVEAETRRDAILVGVQLMRAHERDYHYFRHCDGNPFVGVKAEEIPPPCETHTWEADPEFPQWKFCRVCGEEGK